MDRRLPVTLVGGFLGAGKTSLLHHFITEHRGGYLALMVENPGALNLDARALGGLCGAMRRTQDRVLEIPSIDEDAQVDWIAGRLRELAASGRYERLMIEVAGTANAALLASHFGRTPGDAETFAPWAELTRVVTVVDALDFHRTFVAATRPEVRDGLVELQTAQIEGASLVVLNKCDMVGDAEREACFNLLLKLNRTARILETAFGEVPPEVWSESDALEAEGTEESSMQEPSAGEGSSLVTDVEVGSPELASAVYRAYMPFHPRRFWEWFNAEHPGLLRVKGLIWLATRNLLVGGVSRTRWQNGCGSAGIWWAALPREEWPQDAGALSRMQENWREPYGDRRQELVLVGESTLLAHLNLELDRCLLTDEEYGRPVGEWALLDDPFPAWDLDGEA